MFVKQIDMKEAFRLADKGIEVKVLVPTGPGNGWCSMEPDTLQNMLADVLFFRNEPTMETPDQVVEEWLAEEPELAQEEETNTPPTTLRRLPRKELRGNL